MKAIVLTKYGAPDVLQLKEIEKPIPKDNEILIRIHATTVTAGDCELRSLDFPLYLKIPIRIWLCFRKPRGNTILVTVLAGEVEAIGKDVASFKRGDQIFGSSGMGLSADAEYKCLSEKGVVAVKPANMTFEEAAAVPFGGCDALHFLRMGNIQRGQKILINGAGGSIGTYAVQLARYFGAEVTAVDSTGKLDMLRSIGADHVIDYTSKDYTKNGETYDIIFDVVGKGKSSFSRSIKSLKKNGRYLLANPGFSQLVRKPWASMLSGKKVITQTSTETTEDLIFLKELVESGKIKSVIDKSYSLEQIPEAHRYVETGNKIGNVVIAVVPAGKT